MNKKLIKAVATLGVLGTAFFLGGYALSDNRLAQQLVTSNHLTTPEQVFGYVLSQNIQAPPGSPNNAVGASFKELVRREGHWLWCDEGAVVVAVMVGQLGYETQLVDLIGKGDGISHHTVLQVKQAGQWMTYDFTGRQFGVALEKTVNYPAHPFARKYPTWQHDLLLNNYFLRLLAQQVRPLLK